MADKRKRTPTGIVKRHTRRCRPRAGGACNCQPSYEARLSVRRDGRHTKVRKTFSGEGAFEAAKDGEPTRRSQPELAASCAHVPTGGRSPTR